MRGETIVKSFRICRSIVACGLLGAFLFVMALSAAPRLHERLHPDAKQSQHECAVTFVASGNYDHAVQPPLVSAPNLPIQFSEVPALSPTWVGSLFLSARIFEHAPPARA